METIAIAAIVLVAVLALLVARGMYLIGTGSDVEYEAREKASGSGVANQGFVLLDMLRFSNLPIVSAIEEKLGWGSDSGDPAKCLDCRNNWLATQGTAQPTCPNCGSDHTRLRGGQS